MAEPEDTQVKRIIIPYSCKVMGDTGEVEGFGSAFGNKDLGGDVVEFGAFGKTLEEHKKNGTMPNMFFAHNMYEPVGHWNDLAESKKGLDSKGQVWVGKGIPKAEQAYQLAKNPGEKGLSIGYQTVVSERDEKKKVTILKEVKLREISITPYPMNQKALITSVKTMMSDITKKFTIRELENLLREADFSSAEAKAFLACCKTAYDDEREAQSVSQKQESEFLQSLKGLNDTLKTVLKKD
jgi:HK97 family phage prohead protease